MFTLITGASSGIGEEFARQYAKKGHSLILTARNKEKLEKLAGELKKENSIQVVTIPLDLARNEGADELFQKCNELKIEVNLLINDAGFGLISPFGSQDLNEIQQMILLNILSLTKLTYLFLPTLKKNKGNIINLASQIAFSPAPSMAVYGATKAYVLSFTEAINEELKDSGVHVMALCPGPTYTNFFKRAHSSSDKINFKFRTPTEVVKEAIAGLEDKKNITVIGWENKIFTFMTRFIPQTLLTKMSETTVQK